MDFDKRENRFDYTNNNSNKTGIVKIIIAAMIGSLIGALIMTVVAPYYIYGTIIPWPDQVVKMDNSNYDLPEPVNASLDYTDTEDGSITQVAESVGPAVVGVVNRGMASDWFGNTTMTELGSGSGFIIDPSGLIVTNEHVITNAKEIYVNLSSGAQIEAEIVGVDEWSDIAVLQIDLQDLPENSRSLPYVTFGDSSKVRVGQTAIAIGNPLGLEFARTVTAGIISAVDRVVNVEDRQYSLIQTDAAINAGNSGGPLLDIKGNVIGINQIKISSTGVEGLGFAIPSDQAKPIIEQLIEFGEVIRPYLGVKGLPMNVRYATYLNSKVDYGIYIDEIIKDSPAEKAGIKSGDIIIGMNGEKITSFTELQRILYGHDEGDTVEIEVYRISEDEYITFDVELEVSISS
ncbi:MAG: S1C family serine protease [Clostridia bacterium]